MFDCITKLVKIKRLMLSFSFWSKWHHEWYGNEKENETDYWLFKMPTMRRNDEFKYKQSRTQRYTLKIKLIDPQLMKLCSRAACTWMG